MFGREKRTDRPPPEGPPGGWAGCLAGRASNAKSYGFALGFATLNMGRYAEGVSTYLWETKPRKGSEPVADATMFGLPRESSRLFVALLALENQQGLIVFLG